jgi:hypothetical protein
MDRRFWGGSAVVDSSGVSGWLGGRRRGGGEDPWLCDPGFRRVGSCRGVGPTVGRGTETVKQVPASSPRRGAVRVNPAGRLGALQTQPNPHAADRLDSADVFARHPPRTRCGTKDVLARAQGHAANGPFARPRSGSSMVQQSFPEPIVDPRDYRSSVLLIKAALAVPLPFLALDLLQGSANWHSGPVCTARRYGHTATSSSSGSPYDSRLTSADSRPDRLHLICTSLGRHRTRMGFGGSRMGPRDVHRDFSWPRGGPGP